MMDFAAWKVFDENNCLLRGLHDSISACSAARVQLTSEECAAEAHTDRPPFYGGADQTRPPSNLCAGAEDQHPEARLRDVAWRENIPRRAHAASSAPSQAFKTVPISLPGVTPV